MLFCMLLCCTFISRELFAGYFDDFGVYHPSPGEAGPAMGGFGGMGTGMNPYSVRDAVADGFAYTAQRDDSLSANPYRPMGYDPSLDRPPVAPVFAGQSFHTQQQFGQYPGAVGPFGPAGMLPQQQFDDFSPGMPMRMGRVMPLGAQFGQFADSFAQQPMMSGFQQPMMSGFGDDLMFQHQQGFTPALRNAQMEAALARGDAIGARAIQLAQAQEKKEYERQLKEFQKLAKIQQRGQQGYAQSSTSMALVPVMQPAQPQAPASYGPSYMGISQEYDSVHQGLTDAVLQGGQEKLKAKFKAQKERLKALEAAQESSIQDKKKSVAEIIAERSQLRDQLIAQKARNEEMRAAAEQHHKDMEAAHGEAVRAAIAEHTRKELGQQPQAPLALMAPEAREEQGNRLAQSQRAGMLTTAIQTEVTRDIAAALDNPASTEQDFAKLLMPTKQPDGPDQPPLASLSSLHTYFQSAGTTYAQHRQRLDDLKANGGSAEEIALAENDLLQISKLRNVLEQRRQYELTNIADSIRQKSTLQGDPDEVVRTSVGGSARPTTYTRAQLAQDRLDALGIEEQRLQNAAVLTTELDPRVVEQHTGKLFTGEAARKKLNKQLPFAPLLTDAPAQAGHAASSGSSAVPLLTNGEETQPQTTPPTTSRSDDQTETTAQRSRFAHVPEADQDELVRTYFNGVTPPEPAPTTPSTKKTLGTRVDAAVARTRTDVSETKQGIRDTFTRKDPRETRTQLLVRKVKEAVHGPLPTVHQIRDAKAAPKRVTFAPGTKR